MSLLIHSMSEFSDLILKILAAADARNVAEIGAEFGGMSAHLAAYTAQRGATLTSIDPAPKPEFRDWLAQTPHVRHIAQPSLTALDDTGDIDAWVIDGDHNWFTVYNELHRIDAISRRDEKPLLVLLHDVGWPWARRDLYYAPAQIPEAFRQPFCFDSGVMLGQTEAIPHRGFRGMGQFAIATHEGGPRNGVKTAIEDFCGDKLNAGADLAYAEVPAVFGLGVLFALDAPWTGAVADIVTPYHQNRLLARLEENRLANYLAVIEWQDRAG